MKAETKKFLEEFAAQAQWNTAIGNAADMDRFFDFVVAAYQNGDHDIMLDDFLEVLGRTQAGPNQKRELAGKMFMYTKYEDGIKLLRKFEQQ